MISSKELDNLIALARLELDQKEKEDLLKDFSSILDFVGQIKEASDEDVSTIEHQLFNVLRDDTAPHQGGIFTEDLLAASPDREGQYIKVKKIL